MIFANLIKQSSERSDALNWAKKSLIDNTNFHYEAIEGCNENSNNVVTHLFERAHVDVVDYHNGSDEDTLHAIINLETEQSLVRKIKFANAFGISLSYVLYNDSTQNVWVYEIQNINSCHLILQFESYQGFSNWIASIKGWRSTKPYRERQDLPFFDKELRRYGTPWPTNIDCFFTDANNNPIGIIEFQNANLTQVRNHCNNDFFLGKITRQNQYGHTVYDNDIRRWQSQEILRVQSKLRLFIVTWSTASDEYILKEVDKITFPYLPGPKNWTEHNRLQAILHNFAINRNRQNAEIIAKSAYSYNFVFNGSDMKIQYYKPMLSYKEKTFPYIYYYFKQWKINSEYPIDHIFTMLINTSF